MSGWVFTSTEKNRYGGTFFPLQDWISRIEVVGRQVAKKDRKSASRMAGIEVLSMLSESTIWPRRGYNLFVRYHDLKVAVLPERASGRTAFFSLPVARMVARMLRHLVGSAERSDKGMREAWEKTM